MYRLMVVLKVLDFKALDEFECGASKVMSDYHGKIICAFETERNKDGSGEEVHIVEFQQEEDFNKYKEDPRLQDSRTLRERAIASTEIKAIIREKTYT